ncbi:MAG TPA: S9 family peptidase [Terriglobales bacterium]|nr:S9 family peptidase [Terriglobales bacterium]
MRIRNQLVLSCSFVLLCLGVALSQAKPSLDSAIDSLYSVRGFEQVAISPDASRVAWVEHLSGAEGNGIFVVDRRQPSAKPQRVTASPSGHDEGHIAWSPDGKHLAFLSDSGSEGQLQLYVSNVDGKAARKLTSLTGFLDLPAWSPDGKSIAILFTEDAPRAAGPLMPMTPETGVIADKVYEQRLATVSVDKGNVQQISPADMYVYEYDWSPDSKSLVMTAAHGSGDANWYVAQLYTLPASGGDMKAIYKPPLQIAGPRWSPDGANIAFIAGIMSDEGSVGGDVFLISAAGGVARNLTPNAKASPSSVHWLAPNRLLVGEIVDGEIGFATLDTTTQEMITLYHAPEVASTGDWGMYSISLASDGKTSAVIRQSYAHPPEIWAGPLGNWQQITHNNDQAKPAWGELRSLHWVSDHMQVQGWLLYPENYDPKQHYPMVVCVHGGPAVGEMPYWPEPFFNTALLSAQGYFVFYPNPRGSYGQGEAFTRGNVKDFGYGDFRDILAGVDKIVSELPVDNNRVGITGWSYGGYMTMWAVTQTNRFRAAVAGAGIANYQSYYGENDIDEWMIPYFGKSVYQDPGVYAKSSPITFITQTKTPTLVLVGDRDGECPPPQSREFWHALKALGVDTQLVIYKDEGHFIGQPEHQRDIVRRTIAWFDEHMK